MTAPRVLVAGLPRSGTTWIGEVLGRTAGARYLHEPDNHLVRPEAWWAKRRLGPYPEFHAGADGAEYERLWRVAFAGGPRRSPLYAGARILQRAGAPRVSGRLASRKRPRTAPGPLVVKSVHCARSVEWIADRFGPAVVLVERHPFGVIASWRKLGWDDFLDTDPGARRYSAAVLGVEPPSPSAPWIVRAAWHHGLLNSYLQRARRRHPDWLVVRHEVLCTAPEAGFRRLCESFGLHFTAEAARFLAASNRPGDGYSTNRLWHEQIDGGRRRLSPGEQTLVEATLERFAGAVPVPAPTAAAPAVWPAVGPDPGRRPLRLPAG
jgi:hypothetical protein